MRVPAFVLSAVVALSACQSSDFGSGPVTLSPLAKATFKAYLATPNRRDFAVSLDGKSASYSYCPAHGGACDPSVNPAYVAINGCQNGSHGVPCKVYARDGVVVWKDADAGRVPSIAYTGSDPAAVMDCALPDGTRLITTAAKCVELYDLKMAIAAPERHPVDVDWQGYLGRASGFIDIRRKGTGGSLLVGLPGGKGLCTGAFTYADRRQGTWTLACDNGRRAAGTMTSQGRGAVGQGEDDLGHRIAFRVGADG
ncbi:MAG: hypothetical protein H6907_17170 [Hyphomicrobiales bacterium]|nr:hypothetical protein [Hyphomicrobiales bacterium]